MNIEAGGIGVDATIVIQMINFWIAYCVLRILFFTPAYREVTREDDERARLERSIDAAEQELARRREEQRAVWDACRAYVAGSKPAIDCRYPASEPASLVYHMPADASVRALHTDVSTYLIKKVGGSDG